MNVLECKIKESTMLTDDLEFKQILFFIHPIYYINPDKYSNTHTLQFNLFKN